MSALLIKWGLYVLLAGALVVGAQTAYVSWRNQLLAVGAAQQREIDQRAADKLQKEAAVTLAAALARNARLERELLATKEAQDVADNNNQKTVARLAADLRRMRNAAGQLRDPYARPSECGSSGSAPAVAATAPANVGDDHPAQTPGLLSPELTEFLQQKDAEADEINNAYIACRSDALNLRAQQH